MTTTNADLINRLNFPEVLTLTRSAGGHDEQMKQLFKNVIVLAHWNERDYQGTVATMVELNDTKEVIIYSDYYGSCPGCDAWEDSTDEQAKNMCIQLASNAIIIKNIKEAIEFLLRKRRLAEEFHVSDDVRTNLLEEYNKGRGKYGYEN